MLEVLAALAIASIGLAALAKTISGSVHLTEQTTQRILATWVASNHASELHIAQTIPANETTAVKMASANWSVQRTVQNTADKDIFKITITIKKPNDQKTLAQLVTYLAKFDPAQKTTKPPNNENTNKNKPDDGTIQAPSNSPKTDAPQ